MRSTRKCDLSAHSTSQREQTQSEEGSAIARVAVGGRPITEFFVCERAEACDLQGERARIRRRVRYAGSGPHFKDHFDLYKNFQYEPMHFFINTRLKE